MSAKATGRRGVREVARRTRANRTRMKARTRLVSARRKRRGTQVRCASDAREDAAQVSAGPYGKERPVVAGGGMPVESDRGPRVSRLEQPREVARGGSERHRTLTDGERPTPPPGWGWLQQKRRGGPVAFRGAPLRSPDSQCPAPPPAAGGQRGRRRTWSVTPVPAGDAEHAVRGQPGGSQ
jgi:hypothetical protein